MFINSGNVMINTEFIEFAVSASSRVGKALMNDAKANNTLYNVCGKNKQGSVIVMKDGKVLISSISIGELK